MKRYKIDWNLTYKNLKKQGIFPEDYECLQKSIEEKSNSIIAIDLMYENKNKNEDVFRAVLKTGGTLLFYREEIQEDDVQLELEF